MTKLRFEISGMFADLSRRSQVLIQRQLDLITSLENRELEPDQLASLFQLDHLATRLRRNGEKVLILAGEDPGRRWAQLVPLVDVLRAAASEVEQYERIELARIPSCELIGSVVSDAVHIFAELLENATRFSYGQTRVRATGHALPDGRLLVEISDAGVGLSGDELADINERLAHPTGGELATDSGRLGLLVVSRLGLRHGIRVQMRPGESGGTTAMIMFPASALPGIRQRPAPRPPSDPL
ncbi:hypothetical protein GCM10010195_71150 [Kitasatospora griseola]|nr:hypothetical protein GCM10010195_71150 [Kitasatospora griseola]